MIDADRLEYDPDSPAARLAKKSVATLHELRANLVRAYLDKHPELGPEDLMISQMTDATGTHFWISLSPESGADERGRPLPELREDIRAEIVELRAENARLRAGISELNHCEFCALNENRPCDCGLDALKGEVKA